MLKLIALLERPTRGNVTVGGQNTNKIKSGRIPAYRRAIGVVFQDHKLLVDRPIYDNVALPLVVAGTPLKEVDRRVRAALDQVGLLGKENSGPLELSTGEQQRVGIARAVVSKPPVLIADEPTGNLDPDLALDIMKLFKRLNDVGVTVLVATHDVHLIERFDLRRVTLVQGRVSVGGAALAAASSACVASGQRSSCCARRDTSLRARSCVGSRPSTSIQASNARGAPSASPSSIDLRGASAPLRAPAEPGLSMAAIRESSSTASVPVASERCARSTSTSFVHAFSCS